MSQKISLAVPETAPTEVTHRPRPVTQKQIAERVGVTQQLVALALKDSPNVAEATREKILAVAQELGYSSRANRPARAMAAARHGTRVRNDILAVVFEAMPNAPTMATPYFMPLVDGIEIEAGERQIDLFLVRKSPAGLPWLITEGWVDGVILLGSHSSAGQLGELNLPVMTLGSHLPGTSGITPQDEQGTQSATQHLIELGHRRIAYLGPHLDWASAQPRLDGYLSALRAAGISVETDLIEMTLEEPLEPYGRDGMARLLERGDFTALVCHNDPIAMGAIRLAQENGISVPEELSVTGFDDISVAADFSPAITSVSFSSLEMGRAAVRMVLDDPFQVRHEQFPIELHLRESTAVFKEVAR
ncbi:MAG TPA: LacI family DNA-binding transcriptional regulator [Abditibacteriaceae bacterium]|jgi:LacI family transcriptional regulator